MPLIKSAKKKMRKDKIRTVRNKIRKENLKKLIKKARVEKSAESLQAVFSALDKAAKVNLIHSNKASRLKSRLSVNVTKEPSVVSNSKAAKKATPKKLKKVSKKK